MISNITNLWLRELHSFVMHNIDQQPSYTASPASILMLWSWNEIRKRPRSLIRSSSLLLSSQSICFILSVHRFFGQSLSISLCTSWLFPCCWWNLINSCAMFSWRFTVISFHYCFFHNTTTVCDGCRQFSIGFKLLYNGFKTKFK